MRLMLEDFIEPEVLKIMDTVEKSRDMIAKIDKFLASPKNHHTPAEVRADLIKQRQILCDAEPRMVERLLDIAKLTPTHPLKALG